MPEHNRQLLGKGSLEHDDMMVGRVEFEFTDLSPDSADPVYFNGYMRVLAWLLPIDPDVMERLENASGYELEILPEGKAERMEIVTVDRQRDHRERPWIPIRMRPDP